MQVSKKYAIAVVATMSAGKSTLLNAMMADNLLPTSNMACTSQVFYINDDDHIRDFEGRYGDKSFFSDWMPLSQDLLTQWNKKTFQKIEIRGNLPVISNLPGGVGCVLLDTPGPNNSMDINHEKLTKSIIASYDYSCIICVLNSTVLNSDDEKTLLVLLRKALVDRREKFKIFFVLNKVDEFDIEKEELPSEITAQTKAFLKEIGFDDPVIIPTAAKLSMQLRSLQRKAKKISSQDLIDLCSKTKGYQANIPAYRSDFSELKQNAIRSQIQLMWSQRHYYRQCLQKEKSLQRPWLAIRGIEEPSRRQFLIGDTFFSSDFLGKIDILCGIAFLEKTLELEMQEYLGIPISTYQLQKKIKRKNQQKRTNARVAKNIKKNSKLKEKIC